MGRIHESSLLMDQSCSVLPLRSAKAREFEELSWEKMYARALGLNQIFSAGQTEQLVSNLKKVFN